MVAKAGGLVELRKWHIIVAVFIAVMGPLASVTGAYYSRESAVKELIHNVEWKLSEHKLDTEKRFVQKNELQVIKNQLQKIAANVNVIKGLWKRSGDGRDDALNNRRNRKWKKSN